MAMAAGFSPEVASPRADELATPLPKGGEALNKSSCRATRVAAGPRCQRDLAPLRVHAGRTKGRTTLSAWADETLRFLPTHRRRPELRHLCPSPLRNGGDVRRCPCGARRPPLSTRPLSRLAPSDGRALFGAARRGNGRWPGGAASRPPPRSGAPPGSNALQSVALWMCVDDDVGDGVA